MNRRNPPFGFQFRLVALLVTAGMVWLGTAGRSSNAATVLVTLVLDPNSANNGCTGCTLNGAGTWDLYLSASLGDNFGIASYRVPVENATSIFHRSPRALLSTDPNGIDPERQTSGFTLLRSANNVSSISATQDTVVPTPYLVRGFGQTASSFSEAFPNTHQFSPTSQVSWSDSLLIAEGTYAPGGLLPALGRVAANVLNSATGAATQSANPVCILLGCVIGGPAPIIADFSKSASLNEVISHQMTAANGPIWWSPALADASYTPMFGAPPNAPGLAIAPTWNAATQMFVWNTKGASRGRYTWKVATSNGPNEDTGLITIDVPFVPEPSSLVLFCTLAAMMAGNVRIVRR